MEIENMLPIHWESVRDIYQQGIETGVATFETTVPLWEQWNDAHLKKGRLIAVVDSKVIGWAALTPVSGRCVYAGVSEVSVYVHASARGKGTGKALLTALIAQSEEMGMWTLQAGIFPENLSSVMIHEQCGFRLVGRRERIGKVNGIWKDTLLYEKRSNKTILGV